METCDIYDVKPDPAVRSATGKDNRTAGETGNCLHAVERLRDYEKISGRHSGDAMDGLAGYPEKIYCITGDCPDSIESRQYFIRTDFPRNG